ncbi:MAG: nascent polypeptide-associated complex protein [Candidatus Thermoplasmatota archaeon]
MFPGMGGRGMSPKKIQQMMRQMGIEMDDVDDVEEVIIRTATKTIVFTDASVQKVTAQGSTSWQLTGTPQEKPRDKAPAVPAKSADPATPVYTEDDVKLVMAQAKVSRGQAVAALNSSGGETAEAIVKLLEEGADGA